MRTGSLFLTVILYTFLLNGCSTYTIPVQSFRKQFGGMDSAHLKRVTLLGPAGEIGGRDYYLANPYPFIHCLDKNQQDHIVLNKPSIEIRFTYKPRDRRVVFYFDRIFVTDSTVTGVESRFIPSLRKTLALDSITKIEVQDGHKKFYYANSK